MDSKPNIKDVEQQFRGMSIQARASGHGHVTANANRPVMIPLSSNLIVPPRPSNTAITKPSPTPYAPSSVYPHGEEKIEVLNQTEQQEYLDKMFDEQAREKLHNLPSIPLPKHLFLSSLLPHQEDGVRWLVSRESGSNTNPFFKVHQRSDGTKYHRCSLTGRRQNEAPNPIQGAILADGKHLLKKVFLRMNSQVAARLGSASPIERHGTRKDYPNLGSYRLESPHWNEIFHQIVEAESRWSRYYTHRRSEVDDGYLAGTSGRSRQAWCFEGDPILWAESQEVTR